MNSINNKNILLCVTGSIAAYKACDLLRILRKEGANVQVANGTYLQTISFIHIFICNIV